MGGLIGLAITWVGYSLAWYGWTNLQGPGVGILDLIVPGRTPVHAQEPTTGGGAAGSGPVPLAPGPPGGAPAPGGLPA